MIKAIAPPKTGLPRAALACLTLRYPSMRLVTLHSTTLPLQRETRFGSGRSAYTLVELLVVMAALTVLAAVTLPSIKSLLHDEKVSSASNMVRAHFEAAQARAIAGNSPVAVILERSDATSPNMVTRLSIGQVFPPYEGDTTRTTGTLSDSDSYNYLDTLTLNVGEANLLSAAPAVFGGGDYLQLDDRQSIYRIESIIVTGALAAVKFTNPPFGQEGDLLATTRVTTDARFRMYRKPTKSFLQTLTLPRGTCVDLTVSGFGQSGVELSTNAVGLAMIVFNAQGRIAYWDNGVVGPTAATSLLHVLIGRTEQVSLSTPPMELEIPEDTSTFNANVNDVGNAWLTVNPFTGAINSSGLQAGDEAGAFVDRLKTARTFATYAITQSEK
ncbi:MAG: prepilin-type N-terminal cleavage/methylation domain-containing protein [Pirellulaceae bacterium]|nr:prepilin-type N-terminal cleavage/methylation domain-containing protein [Pirellulaceae bacterium]